MPWPPGSKGDYVIGRVWSACRVELRKASGLHAGDGALGTDVASGSRASRTDARFLGTTATPAALAIRSAILHDSNIPLRKIMQRYNVSCNSIASARSEGPMAHHSPTSVSPVSPTAAANSLAGADTLCQERGAELSGS